MDFTEAFTEVITGTITLGGGTVTATDGTIGAGEVMDTTAGEAITTLIIILLIITGLIAITPITIPAVDMATTSTTEVMHTMPVEEGHTIPVAA